MRAVLRCRGAHPPTFDSLHHIFRLLPFSSPSQPERVGDECAQCGVSDPKRWARSKILVRADGSPAPLCLSPCYTKECKEIKKEQKEA